jgi:putative two-component system response regulator
VTKVNDRVKILIVDDEPCVRGLLTQFLSQEGYDCIAAEDGNRALNILERENIPVVLLDMLMPGLNGISLLQEVKKSKPLTEAIMVTGFTDIAKAVEAMRLGASDYVLKPFHLKTVLASVHRALENRRLLLESREYQDRLEEKIFEKTSELIEKNARLRLIMLNTVQSLVHTLEAKDKRTEGHSKRVALLAVLLAKRLGFPETSVEQLRLSGILHDIGKIGVREECLNKRGKLTGQEYDEIKKHPLISERILEPIEELREILPGIRHHHERYDGRGYPHGLKGEDIPQYARILAMADCYDAMTSDRPYRSALTVEKALKEMRVNAGKQFDPQLVPVFLDIRNGLEILRNLGDGDIVRESPLHLPFPLNT